MLDTRPLALRLHAIISRMSRENGEPDEMATIGEAAARIMQLETAPHLDGQ